MKSEVGQGTTFSIIFSFPLAGAEEKPELDEHEIDTSIFSTEVFTPHQKTLSTREALPKEVEHKEDKPQILLIEDDLMIRTVVYDILKQLNTFVQTAPSVKAGIEAVSQQKYDLVICDLGLDDGTGFDVIAWVKENKEHPNQETPFVVLTANNDGLKRQEILNQGFSEILQKPLSKENAKYLINKYCPQAVDNISRNILDFDKTLALTHGTREDTIKLLHILSQTLHTEKILLVAACRENDIEKTRAILHKLKGALSYCGVNQLHKARDNLHEAVSTTSQLSSILTVYNQFFHEITEFDKALENLVKKSSN